MSDLGFWRQAAAHPDRVVLIDPEGDEVTGADLAAASHQLARGLAERCGLQPGDTIVTVLPNGRPMLEVYLAAIQSGWYITPVNWHLVGPEIAYIVANAGAKALVGSAEFADELTRAADEAGVPAAGRLSVGDVDGFASLESVKVGQSTEPTDWRRAGMAMHYTSGTTGKPKGVQRALADIDPDDMGALYTGFLGMFGVQAGDDNVHIVGSPLYHTAVLMCCGSSLHMGHTVVLMDKWTPESMLQLIAEHRVTTSHMVPTQFHRLLALPESTRAKYDVSSLRTMIHAAAPCPPEIKQRMLDWWGDAVWEYYAATEGGGSIVSPQEWRKKPGTVGHAWPGSELRIYSDDGDLLPAGEIGTVYMSLAMANFEYKDDAGKTQENRRDGFFTVGDVGYLDDDGYLFLCDRKSDMIISGGVNIYPAEIENVLLTHPKVGDAAVFGIPHADWGEEIKAVIQPEEGNEASPALADEILAFCDGRLAKFKRPRTIDFIVDMPRDPNGKLYKRRLRDPYWEGQDRAI